MDQGKKEIVRRFIKNIKGEKIDLEGFNAFHDGREGHWLETKMEIKINNLASSDIFGYEMKKNSSKISFGDWSADYYIFHDSQHFNRESFIKTFGTYKPDKNRWSWSGHVFPKVGQVNEYGQTMRVDPLNNIDIIYFYNLDTRIDKEKMLPFIHQEELLLANWSHEKLRNKVNSKFGNKGWFICTKNKEGVYEDIRFGEAFNFEFWIKHVKTGEIYCDSGMYHDPLKPNRRPYSTWRANGNFWHNLATEIYDECHEI